MTAQETLCTTYRENARMIEALQAENDAIKQQLIAALAGAECAVFGASKVSYKPVMQTRLDGKALKAAMPAVYAAYSSTTTYNRFTVQ